MRFRPGLLETELPGEQPYRDRPGKGLTCVNSWRAIWMQTTAAPLLAVSKCSSPRVWTLAQDSRSAYGLLYLAAVRADRRKQKHCQGMTDSDPSLVSYRHTVGHFRSPGNLASRVTRSIGECRMSLWSAVV